MLHSALEEAQRSFCPLVRLTVDAAIGVAEAVPEVEAAQQRELQFLSSSTGPLHARDPGLADALSALVTGHEAAFQRVPEGLLACLVLTELWAGSVYHQELEAMSGNEHVAAYALAKLLRILCANDGSLEAECVRFLSLSSQLLLDVRARERDREAGGKKGDRIVPLTALTLLPKMFLSHCSFLSSSHLEQTMPYALVHACQVNTTPHDTTLLLSLRYGIDGD